MKLLFITQNARLIQDCEGFLYLNSHMNKNIIKRYADISTELHMVIRDSGIRCSKEEASLKYDEFPYYLAEPIVGPNPYLSIKNYINPYQRKKFTKMLRKEICWADKVIISAATGYYAQKAIPICKEKRTDYLLLVGGFAFETYWFTSFKGKLVACYNEKICKLNLKNALFALYVTKQELQRRYPCKGKIIGCSDVEINDLSEDILTRRLNKIQGLEGKKVILGTAASLSDRRKGHIYVIRALAELKKQGIPDLEYQVIGGGSADYIKKCANKFGVSSQVKVIGTFPHGHVFGWLDSIDIYIQPSLSEGLCRAVVEAMSRACPVICSDTGGNIELCRKEYLFSVGDVTAIVELVKKMSNRFIMEREAKNSFKIAKEYSSDYLDKIRKEFLVNFINNRME